MYVLCTFSVHICTILYVGTPPEALVRTNNVQRKYNKVQNCTCMYLGEVRGGCTKKYMVCTWHVHFRPLIPAPSHENNGCSPYLDSVPTLTPLLRLSCCRTQRGKTETPCNLIVGGITCPSGPCCTCSWTRSQLLMIH